MSISPGNSFFKNPTAPVLSSTTPVDKPANRLVGVRLLDNHPMSVIDTYLYTFSSEHKGLRLNDLGGLDIGLGPGYTFNIKDLPHVHGGPSYKVIDGELYRTA